MVRLKPTVHFTASEYAGKPLHPKAKALGFTGFLCKELEEFDALYDDLRFSIDNVHTLARGELKEGARE